MCSSRESCCGLSCLVDEQCGVNFALGKFVLVCGLIDSVPKLCAVCWLGFAMDVTCDTSGE